uniref:TolC family outer membrane protein n=1 Tax=uncultured Caulobacter sp. TaxID=158749 RepID=UPI0025F13C94|nr:TolC family outer membrane protein [uncultured Caulobacter sp.]
MSNRRRAGLLAAACSAGLMVGAFSAAHAESLADAAALAYQTNPTLQQQRAVQRATDESVVRARAGFRPTLNAQASATNSRTDLAVPTTTVVGGVLVNGVSVTKVGSSNAQLQLSQPLFTGGQATANLSAAEADVLAGREDLRRAEQGMLANVVTAYVDVRRTQQALRIANENVAVLTRQLDESNARFEVGEITRTDVAQSQARLAAAKASQSSAQANLAVARANYAQVVGQNPADLAPEPSLANVLPASVEQAFETAEGGNPAVQAARYAEQAAAARVALAKAAYLPTISAGASLGFDAAEVNGNRNQFGQYNRQIAGSLTARVPLFTGGLNASNVRAARERETAARVAVEGAKRQVIQQVSAAWSTLLASRASLVSNEEQVRAARIAFEGVRQEQQVGLRTTLDVLNAQLELSNAELALVTARRDEYVASTSLLQAMGQLDVTKLASGTAAYDPKTSYNRVTHSAGWVPWEPVVQAIDKVGAPSTKPRPASK